MESLKISLFDDESLCFFTPKGDLKKLPSRLYPYWFCLSHPTRKWETTVVGAKV